MASGRLRVLGCYSCHGEGLRGDKMFDEPNVATICAPNLTHVAARATDEQLARAIRQGIGIDGRTLFIMPSEAYQHLNDQEVAALIAASAPCPPAAAIRRRNSYGPIGRLGVAIGKFRTAPELVAEYAGKEPLRIAGHDAGHRLAVLNCSGCHNADLTGKEVKPGEISPDLSIVGAYDLAQFTTLMRTGRPAAGQKLKLMATVARSDLSHMTDDEIAAALCLSRGAGADAQPLSVRRNLCARGVLGLSEGSGPCPTRSQSSSAACAKAASTGRSRARSAPCGRQSRLLDRRDRRPAALQPGSTTPIRRSNMSASASRSAQADGVLFVSPEYNRGIPGVLKNAIDIGSRPYGQSVFDKKPAAIVTASPGSIGGFGANHQIRQAAVFLNMPVMQQPEAYLGHVSDDSFDESGCLKEGPAEGDHQGSRAGVPRLGRDDPPFARSCWPRIAPHREKRAGTRLILLAASQSPPISRRNE